MNLNLIAYPGPAATILAANIEQRIQVPHVPLKFNTETEDVVKVAVIDNPIDAVSKALTEEASMQLFIDVYNSTLDQLDEAIAIYRSEDVIDNTQAVILHLFNLLQLDEDNYKVKTGRESLLDDVTNSQAWFDQYSVSNDYATNVEKTKEFNLEKSWELYNALLEKTIKFS